MFTVAGFWEASSYIPDIVQTIWPDANELLTNRWLLQYLFGFLFLIPCLITTRMSWFAPFAWLSMFGLLLAIGCMLSFLVRSHLHERVIQISEAVYFNWDLGFLKQCLGELTTGLFAHPFLASIVLDMSSPTLKQTVAVTWWSNVICAIFTYSVPAIGYLYAVHPELEDDIFYYLKPQASEVILGKITILLVSLISTLLYTSFLAKTLAGWLLRPEDRRKVPIYVSGVALTFLGICINLMGDAWLLLIYAMGTISFTVLECILPSVCYLAQFGLTVKKWAWTLIIVLSVGTLITIWEAAATFMDWLTE
jgi:hypothetical protein